jgi:soluble lytic murein transglycosylase-like protein/TolA-binding protein
MYNMKKVFALALLAVVACTNSHTQSVNDAALRRITESDNQQRSNGGTIPDLSLAEHLQRAETYSSNRLFPQARAHWQKVLDRFPDDPAVAKALFGIGRSYMWERDYATAAKFLLRAAEEFPSTKDGREGLAFSAASNVRMGSNLAAAALYQKYISLYPDGERIESAYLNIIDAYREAGKYAEAEDWVNRTRQRFEGKPAEANAVHARLRMEIYRQKWNDAVAAADDLLKVRLSGSMTSTDEVKYLKALSLDKLGRKSESAALYASLSPSPNSYYGGLAFEKLNPKGTIERTVPATAANYNEYPVVFQNELKKNARSRKIDPRFVLAIMKQESTFKPSAKSPAGARGLLQLVFDTALKYNVAAGFPSLDPDDLYTPAVNIAIGSVYISELKDEFNGLYEAVAASYNGGEDNAARWLNRTKPKDPGLFAAEVGFAESKNYLFRVMNNYRAYRDLYTEDLSRR